MSIRLIGSAILFLLAASVTSCGPFVSANPQTPQDIARDEFELALTEAKTQGLVPVLPAGSAIQRFRLKGETYITQTNVFDVRSGTLFMEEDFTVCIAKEKEAIEATCRDGGTFRFVSDAYVYVVPANEAVGNIGLGADDTSLRRAFNYGWETWLDG